MHAPGAHHKLAPGFVSVLHVRLKREPFLEEILQHLIHPVNIRALRQTRLYVEWPGGKLLFANHLLRAHAIGDGDQLPQPDMLQPNPSVSPGVVSKPTVVPQLLPEGSLGLGKRRGGSDGGYLEGKLLTAGKAESSRKDHDSQKPFTSRRPWK